MFFILHDNFVFVLSTLFTVAATVILGLGGVALCTCLFELLGQHRRQQQQQRLHKDQTHSQKG